MKWDLETENGNGNWELRFGTMFILSIGYRIDFMSPVHYPYSCTVLSA